MSPNRLAAAVAAAALSFSVLSFGAPLASASAAPAGSPTAETSSRQAQLLPERTVTAAVIKRGSKLIMKGKVSPGHANKTVLVQKKKCKSCAWKVSSKVTTTDESRYRLQIYAPPAGSWFWRAKIRKYGKYAVSYSPAWRTYRA
jgi:hypothetical protein